MIGRDEVDHAVEVEIAGADLERAGADGEEALGSERPRAVAEANPNFLLDLLGDGEVGLAVAVHVGEDERLE